MTNISVATISGRHELQSILLTFIFHSIFLIAPYQYGEFARIFEDRSSRIFSFMARHNELAYETDCGVASVEIVSLEAGRW